MLLSLRGILVCRIRPPQPSGGSEQVFLPRCHLRTRPSPVTTLGFCAEKGRLVMAGLGTACGRCIGEQGGLGETRGLSAAVAELGSWAVRVQAASGGTPVEEQGLVVSPLGREPLQRAAKLCEGELGCG